MEVLGSVRAQNLITVQNIRVKIEEIFRLNKSFDVY
jgi:hypothetical protein